MLKVSKRFEWTDKCEQAFQALKEHLGCPLLLSKPIKGEKLYLYLAISEEAVSSALVREEEKVQWHIYYVSERLLDSETRYPKLEKLALGLVVASKKFRPYFLAHSIEVLTNYPLHQVLQKPEASGRLLKWAIELGQFDVNFCPRTAIKKQALADFIAEFTYVDAAKVAGIVDNAEVVKVAKAQGEKNFAPAKGDVVSWALYVDDTSNDTIFGAGIMLISPKRHKIHCALCFELRVLNNEVEYEALIVGLRLAKEQ